MGIKCLDSHLFLPWSSIGPVDLAVGHSVPSEPIPVNEEWYWADDGNNKSTNTTLEGRVWMGRICNPNPCENNLCSISHSIFVLILFHIFSEAPPIHKAEEEVPIVLGPKVIWVPINSPQFC